MVLPVTEMSMRQQQRRLHRINEKARPMLSDQTAKEQAKWEVHKAVQDINQKTFGPETVVSQPKSRTPSDDSAFSQASAFSTELAVRRGSLLAQEETNDEHESMHQRYYEDTMLRSISEEDSALPIGEDEKVRRQGSRFRIFSSIKKAELNSGVSKRRRFSLRRNKRRQADQSTKQPKMLSSRKRTLSKDITNLFDRTKEKSRDAWMCGCCGKVFSSYEVAEAHESKCILQSVERLGYSTVIPPSSVQFSTIREEDRSSHLDGTQRTHNQQDQDVNSLMRDLDLHPESIDEHQQEGESFALDTSVSQEHTQPRSRGRPPEAAPRNVLPKKRGLFKPNNPSLQTRIDDVGRELAVMSEKEGETEEGVLAPKMGQTFRRGPKRRRRLRSIDTNDEYEDVIMPSNQLRQNIVVTDEALVNVVKKAVSWVVTDEEIDAEQELRMLAKDKEFYDMMTKRANVLRTNPLAKFRTDGKNFVSKVQNKFVDAYQLIKEGDAEDDKVDLYENKRKEGASTGGIQHNRNTHYVNVIVRHSIKVVNIELERLAKKRWEESRTEDRFERFRAFAQGNLVKLATLALSVDFTPRKMAVQLSNDLYRLIVPQLKQRGVKIETEIEYRVGAYFVLAVNVEEIDWVKLLKYNHRDIKRRAKAWKRHQKRRDTLNDGTANANAADNSKPGLLKCAYDSLVKARNMLKGVELVAQFLGLIYYLHWTIAIPLCWIAYKIIIPSRMRKYILSTVTDDVLSYVEQKGMDMQIRVVEPEIQAAFMLQALRELREDNRVAKKKRKETEADDKGTILGPFLGAAIPADKGPAPAPPAGFAVPENLEFIGLDLDLPVGFKRLRWAMLNAQSKFMTDVISAEEAKNENIEVSDWTKHHDIIGLPALTDGVTDDDIVGAENDSSYLMPRSAFVKANTAYETTQITAYNDYCFCVKKRTRNPEVPYGGTFVAWTQYVITNTGNNTCHMVCSVEAEFPNGPPLIARQIQSGMRSGVAQLFVLIGETICKYADEYP